MLIPKKIFYCKNGQFYIPAAFGGGDIKHFLTIISLGIKTEKKSQNSPEIFQAFLLT